MIRERYLATLDMDENLAKLKGLLPELISTEQEETAARNDIALQKAGLVVREAELLLEGIDGKNEAERKAVLALRLAQDENYKLILANLHRSESDLSAAQVKGAALRQEWQYHRIVLEVGIAKLGFLAPGFASKQNEEEEVEA